MPSSKDKDWYVELYKLNIEIEQKAWNKFRRNVLVPSVEYKASSRGAKALTRIAFREAFCEAAHIPTRYVFETDKKYKSMRTTGLRAQTGDT